MRDFADGSDLLQILRLRGYEAAAITARYIPPEIPPGFTKSVKCDPNPPLTWHLTEVEKTCIDWRWQALKPDLIGEINRFFAAHPEKASGVPEQVSTTQVKQGLYVQTIMH